MHDSSPLFRPLRRRTRAAVFCASGLLASIASAVPLVDLALDQHLAALFGPFQDDRIPYETLVGSGDLNDDGVGDIVFGTLSGDSPTVADTGSLYVVFGPLAPGLRQDLATAVADVSIYGSQASDWLGHMPLVADVSGDGVDDLVVAAHGAEGPGDSRPNCGEVYAFFGPLVPGVIDLASAVPDVVIYGADIDDRFGQQIRLGDIDDDGALDIIGAAVRGDGPSNGRSDVGELHVVFGPFATGTTRDLAATPADVVIYGIDDGDWFGYEVAVGDVTGDGVDDIAAYGFNTAGLGNAGTRSGEVAIVFGPHSAGTTIDLAGVAADVMVYGAADLHFTGRSMAIGDLSGDGNPDLAIGSHAHALPTGHVHVFFAPLVSGTVIDLANQGADVHLSGRETLGFRVWIDDITHDGADDLVVSATHIPSPRSWAGLVDVYAGPFTASTTIDVATASPALRVLGADDSDLLGAALGSGDVTGDNLPELFVGSHSADGLGNARLDAGEVHVIRLEDAIDLAAQFDSIRATRRSDGVLIEWSTTLERDSVAFRVERSSARTGPFVAVGDPIAAHGAGYSYAVHDSEAAAWYRVVEYTVTGRGDVSPAIGTTVAGGHRQRRSELARR